MILCFLFSSLLAFGAPSVAKIDNDQKASVSGHEIAVLTHRPEAAEAVPPGTLQVDGKPYQIGAERPTLFLKEMATKDGVSFVLVEEHGSDNCPAMYRIVEISKTGKVLVSKSFGNCGFGRLHWEGKSLRTELGKGWTTRPSNPVLAVPTEPESFIYEKGVVRKSPKRINKK